MKKSITILISVFLLLLNTLYAQDEFYSTKKNKKDVEEITPTSNETVTEDDYSTISDYYNKREARSYQPTYDNNGNRLPDSTDYYTDENGNTYITNNYYYGDNYDFENEYYDYEYASRIRRFHRNYYGFGYYDDCYTNYYWYTYDPFLFGTSIYIGYSWWRPRPWRYYYGWSWGWNYGWSYGWAWNPYGYYGYSYWGWGAYNNGYWNGYWDGYYAGSYYPNYYNSYDGNSYYYGHRGNYNRTSFSTIASNNTGGNNTNQLSHMTFGQKYEAVVGKEIAKNPLGQVNASTVKKPKLNQTKGNGVSTNQGLTKNNVNYPKTYNNSGVQTKSNVGNNQTKGNGVNTDEGLTKNNVNNPNIYNNNDVQTKPNVNNPNTYTHPKQVYSKPKTYSNPKQYSKPTPSYTKPSKTYNYSKPKTSKGSYSRPKPSYSKPSYNKGGSYSRPAPSRGGGSINKGSYGRGGGRRF
jgi:hypothetical protein